MPPAGSIRRMRIGPWGWGAIVVLLILVVLVVTGHLSLGAHVG